MWAEGTAPNGDYIRRSLKTRSWERALQRIREMESGQAPAAPDERVTVEQAIEEFLSDAAARGLRESSLAVLAASYRELLGWTQRENYRYVRELDFGAVRAFRATWRNAPRTKALKQVRLNAFFRFCVQNRWIAENPAAGLSRIRVEQAQTGYFTREEFAKLEAAAAEYGQHRGPEIGRRMRALVLLMRWSGLRVTDACALERSRLQGNNLLLYQAKTGTPVYVPLPPFVAELLEGMSAGPGGKYFFWDGIGKRVAASRNARAFFNTIGERLQLGKRCHAHMLRDTFAVEMLLAGVPLDQVSMLLGHTSIATTARHYSPWVAARQDQLAASVRQAWERA